MAFACMTTLFKAIFLNKITVIYLSSLFNMFVKVTLEIPQKWEQRVTFWILRGCCSANFWALSAGVQWTKAICRGSVANQLESVVAVT